MRRHTAAASRPSAFACGERFVRSQMPVIIPSRTVASRRKVAQQAFRVARAFIQAAREDVAIDPGGEIQVVVEEREVANGETMSRYRYKAKEHPVADEQSGGETYHYGDLAGCKQDQHSQDVTDGKTLENSVDAQGGKVEIRKSVDDQAEEDEENEASKGVWEDVGCGGSLFEPAGERKHEAKSP